MRGEEAMKTMLIGLVLGALFSFGLVAVGGGWLPWSGGPEYIANDLGELVPGAAICALLGYLRHRQQKNSVSRAS